MLTSSFVKRLWRYLIFCLVSLALSLLFYYSLFDITNDMDNLLLDFKYNFKELVKKKEHKISKNILLVDDDDLTKQNLDYSPLLLDDWNNYIDKLASYKTKVIALYLPEYFPDKNKEATQKFINNVSNYRSVILPFILDNEIQINSKTKDNDPKLFYSIDGIERTKPIDYKKISVPFVFDSLDKRQLGFSNLVPSRDGTIRKIPLIATLNGRVVLSYTLSVAASFLDIDVSKMKIENRQLHLWSKKLNKTLIIPLTEKNEMYIHFYKNIKENFLVASLFEILGSSETSSNLSNHTVISISSASDGLQKYKTPVHPFMPGGLIVATALNTIVSELFTVPRNGADLVISLFVLSIILICFALLLSPSNKTLPIFASNSLYIFFGFLWILAFPLLTCVVFTYLGKELSTFIPEIFLIIFVFLTSIYKLIVEDREKKILMGTLRGFVSTKKIDFLLTPQGSELMLSTRKRQVSILLTDIVDFSNWSNFHSPDFIFKTLKKYYSTIEEIIFRQGGTIDKKMGDSLLAFFGDLEFNPNHADDALKAAIAIQLDLKKQNFPFITRVGINTGEVILGNLGTDKHLDYTAIGSAVNMTKRIEENCIPGGILLGETAYDSLKNKSFDFNKMEISIKEQKEVLTCYNLVLESI